MNHSDMKIEAVIFDLDGVLIDSEPLHALADNQLLIESGIITPDNYFDRFVGITNWDMWTEIKREYSIELSIEELMELQMPMKLKLLKEMDFIPVRGVTGLLEELKRREVPMAIASSSPRLFIESVIQKIGINEYFKVWISGEEVEHGKPEPDIFLKAAELLNVSPNACVVIEDSASGTVAAKRAGMKCIGYRNLNSGNQDLSQADYIIDEIKSAEILSVLSGDE
jgi:HAD superfamily hydrolase (TIGR01509 family)